MEKSQDRDQLVSETWPEAENHSHNENIQDIISIVTVKLVSQIFCKRQICKNLE